MKNMKLKSILGTAFIAATLTACGKADIQLNNDTVTVELGTEISSNVEDYITTDDEDALEDIILDTSAVDTDTVGEYTATVTYGKDVYTVTVNVVDTTAPEITVSKKEVTVGDTVKIADLATAEDLTNVTLTFEDGSDTWTAETAGNTVLTVVAVDANGNETKEEVTVTVKEAEPEETEEAENELITGTVDRETSDTEDANAETKTTKKTETASSATSGTTGTSGTTATGTTSTTTSAPAASTITTQSNTASSSTQATTGTTTSTTGTSGTTNTTDTTTTTTNTGSYTVTTGQSITDAGNAMLDATLNNNGVILEGQSDPDRPGASGYSKNDLDALWDEQNQ